MDKENVSFHCERPLSQQNDEIPPSAATGIELEHGRLSEISERQKDKRLVFSLMQAKHKSACRSRGE